MNTFQVKVQMKLIIFPPVAVTHVWPPEFIDSMILNGILNVHYGNSKILKLKDKDIIIFYLWIYLVP